MMIKKNPERGGLYAALFATVAGILLCFVPFLFEWDMMDGGFAFVLVCGLAVIGCIVASWIFWRRFRIWKRVMRGDDILAEWKLSPDAWSSFIESEVVRDAVGKKAILGILIVITVLVALGGLLLFDIKTAWGVAAVLGGVVLICIVVAFWNFHGRARALRKSPPRVLIGNTFAILGTELHVWDGLEAQLESAILQQDDSSTWIAIRYSCMADQGQQNYHVHLPVPESALRMAKLALATLTGTQPPPDSKEIPGPVSHSGEPLPVQPGDTHHRTPETSSTT